MEQKRVLIVGNFLSGANGSRGVCEDLSERLTIAGWQVIAVSYKPGRFARLIDMVRTTWHERHRYSVAQVDVFSGPAFFWAEAVAFVLRKAHKPFVLTLRGGNLPVFARHQPSRMGHLLQSADIVTTPSRYLFEQMSIYQNNLHLLPNPLNLPAYEFRLRSKPQPNLVWLRAFHQIYNPSLAPQILAQLASEFPEIQLIMIGPDKGDGSLQKTQRIAATLGVGERIQYPGQIAKKDVPTWLNKGDIFLNTTNIDNTPVSVMEAMASGLCVVSTNVGGIPYLLAHEQDALLIRPDNVEQGVAAIHRLLTDSNLATNLSQNARDKMQLFDWPIILAQWEKLLLAVSAKI
jgi:glycosyltransferase involved in cell wall biosynthesis